MRSSSRRPWPSNRHSSTFCALAENNAKLVPRPSQLAPRREGAPADNRISGFRYEKYRGQRRDRERKSGDEPFPRLDFADISNIAPAVVLRIRIEDLTPLAGVGDADGI